MNKTQAQLKAKIDGMPVDDLRNFAREVVNTLYGELHVRSAVSRFLNESEVLLNPEKSWNVETVAQIAETVVGFGLHPDQL